jgi:hexosaminidase
VKTLRARLGRAVVGVALLAGATTAAATNAASAATPPLQAIVPVPVSVQAVTGADHTLTATATPQFWGTTTSSTEVSNAVARGSKVILSPANKAYLDMKYNASTLIGLSWAGYIEVQDAYNWNPGAYLSGVPESAVRGVESPLWTETVVTPANIDYLAFPRLAAHAELGWSPWSTYDWNVFRARLGAQAPRWQAQGISFYASGQVPWETGTGNPGTCSLPAWSATSVYNGGTSVSHNGHKWYAKWWTQGEEPGTTGQWGVWRDDGAC